MILLDKNEYHKALEPLRTVEINHLFASAVVEGHISGTIYVDDVDNPASFYVVHPYGMSLLFGDTPNEEFNSWLLGHALNTFNIRNRYEWLQAFPDTWNKRIATRWEQHLVKSKDNTGGLKNNKIEENTRVNFKFNKDKYLDFKSNYPLTKIKTHRTDNEMFGTIQGSVIPAHFWDNVDDFNRRAVAFSMLDGDKIASTAFSAFVVGKQLEIGIETSDVYQGKGYAIYTCSALIDYCLENDYEPIWACRLENTASYQLARKLGFEPTIYWPFYRLND
jgi:GNAT superfamily N-acetyltransferase